MRRGYCEVVKDMSSGSVAQTSLAQIFFPHGWIGSKNRMTNIPKKRYGNIVVHARMYFVFICGIYRHGSAICTYQVVSVAL